MQRSLEELVANEHFSEALNVGAEHQPIVGVPDVFIYQAPCVRAHEDVTIRATPSNGSPVAPL
jgi:hypothetical protein